MARPKKKYKTFHISVPDDDAEILEWLSQQFNQSASVRQLIRVAIDEGGMVDYFSGRMYNRQPGQSGRALGASSVPEKLAKESRQNKGQLPSKQKASGNNGDKNDKTNIDEKRTASKNDEVRTGNGISLDLNILSDTLYSDTDKSGDVSDKKKSRNRLDSIRDMLDS